MNMKAVRKILSSVLIGVIVLSAGIIVITALRSIPRAMFSAFPGQGSVNGNGNYSGTMPNRPNGATNPNANNGNQKIDGSSGVRIIKGTDGGNWQGEIPSEFQRSASASNIAGIAIYALSCVQIAASVAGLIYLYTRKEQVVALPYDDEDDEDDDDEDDDE